MLLQLMNVLMRTAKLKKAIPFLWMMTLILYHFKERTLNQTEEAILISWRLQQWFEGMVLDARAMQDAQDAIEMLKTLAKQVQK